MRVGDSVKTKSLVIIAVVVVAAVAGGEYYINRGGSSGGSSNSTTVDMQIVGGVGVGTVDTYVPDNFTVKLGQNVTLAITNTDDNTHGLVLAPFGVNTGLILPGTTDRVWFIANQTGVFKFDEPPSYCQGGYGGVCNSVQHMWGYITVAP
jgi:heme/copper-type cytochrome/quinol oxidase subunit 2